MSSHVNGAFKSTSSAAAIELRKDGTFTAYESHPEALGVAAGSHDAADIATTMFTGEYELTATAANFHVLRRVDGAVRPGGRRSSSSLTDIRRTAALTEAGAKMAHDPFFEQEMTLHLAA